MKYTIKDIGCYVDGSNGIASGKRIQEIAISHGWKGAPYLDYKTGNEDYDYATEEAIEFMNDAFPVDGAYWGWNDGDFGLYAIEMDI